MPEVKSRLLSVGCHKPKTMLKKKTLLIKTTEEIVKIFWKSFHK